jgi:hypothetical protein
MKQILRALMVLAWIQLFFGCKGDVPAPYDEELSGALLLSMHGQEYEQKHAVSLDSLDPEKIHIVYKPLQNQAYPIVENPKPENFSYSITSECEMKELIKVLRGYSSIYSEEIDYRYKRGTLHVIIEFKGMPDNVAYFIIYCNTATVAPIFSFDSHGIRHKELLHLIAQKHSSAFRLSPEAR